MTIPERRLSESARARRRTELMEAISGESRRRPWLAPLAAAAAVAVVGGAAYGTTTLGSSDEPGPQPLGGGPASAPDSSAAETGAPPSSATAEPCGSERPQNRADQMGAYRAQLSVVQAYRDVLASHLDPSGEHLDPKTTNVQSSGGRCGLTALGTKVGWSTAGEEGLGMVQVEVGTGAGRTQVRMAHGRWRPLRVDVEGVTSAEQVAYDGGFAVEVDRDDGVTVAVDANLLFGNNSDIPVGAFPFEVADLVEVAADPALQLP